MKESLIGPAIQIALAKVGVRLFRNNTGSLKNDRGEYITYGLCKGSSDYIGWRTVEVTPEMVGNKHALFVACEVKQPGKKATPVQENFIAVVREAGGIGVVATSVKEALDAIQR